MGAVNPNLFFPYTVSTALCFFASSMVNLILLSGIRVEHRMIIWILSFGMWIVLTTFTFCFVAAAIMTNPSYSITSLLTYNLQLLLQAYD
jgi:hypothetical protein